MRRPSVSVGVPVGIASVVAALEGPVGSHPAEEDNLVEDNRLVGTSVAGTVVEGALGCSILDSTS